MFDYKQIGALADVHVFADTSYLLTVILLITKPIQNLSVYGWTHVMLYCRRPVVMQSYI